MEKIVNCWLSWLHVHRGFIQLLKLWLNLCLFRWLNPSWSFVINIIPSRLKMPNVELGMGRIIFIKLALKILKLDVRILKLSLFHSFIAHGKTRILECISPARIRCNNFLYSECYISGIQRGLTQLNKIESHYF